MEKRQHFRHILSS